jgi:hypothetical protein
MKEFKTEAANLIVDKGHRIFNVICFSSKYGRL